MTANYTATQQLADTWEQLIQYSVIPVMGPSPEYSLPSYVVIM